MQQRKGLVAAVLHYASALGVPQEVAHSAVTLMDRVMMSGVHMTDQFQTLFICACLRLAALHEDAAPPSGLAVSSLTDFPSTRSLAAHSLLSRIQVGWLTFILHGFAVGSFSRGIEVEIFRLPLVCSV